MAKFEQNNSNLRVGYKIKFSPVQVIDETGANLGNLPIEEARRRAQDVGMDLVEISPTARPPVCRIMDFGRHKYEQSIKEKKARQKQKESQLKEVRFRPMTGDHDIDVKVRSIRGFLEDGHRVQLRVKFKARENAHKELGAELVKKIVAKIEDLGTLQKQPKFEEKNLVCIVEPKK